MFATHPGQGRMVHLAPDLPPAPISYLSPCCPCLIRSAPGTCLRACMAGGFARQAEQAASDRAGGEGWRGGPEHKGLGMRRCRLAAAGRPETPLLASSPIDGQTCVPCRHWHGHGRVVPQLSTTLPCWRAYRVVPRRDGVPASQPRHYTKEAGACRVVLLGTVAQQFPC
jgi:hypothetical protein